MNNSSGRLIEALLLALSMLILSTGAAGAAETATEFDKPDFAAVTRALDGDSAAIESLIACAENHPECRMIAAAARHRQDRTDEAIELLRPLLAIGHQDAMRVVAELAFERKDYPLAWAVGSSWMEANDLEPPEAEIRDQGARIPWLAGQSASRLSAAELDQARQMAAELRASGNSERQDGSDYASNAQQKSTPDVLSRAAPQYPRALALAGAGGWAISVLSVSADGDVEEVHELFASHRALARNTAKAMREWRFEPVEKGDWWTHQLIDFSLSRQTSAIPESESGIADEQGWIRFDNARGWIEFTVRVNGVLTRAMLDSGSQTNAISRQLVERAGIDRNRLDEVRVRGIYGERRVSTVDEFEMQFGRAMVPMRDVVVLPMRSPDLILGVGLFQAGVVQIDYPNKRLRFLRRDAVDFEGNVRVRTEGGRSPQIRAELAGKKVWMLLDTGNAGATLFKRRLIRRLDLDRYAIDGAQVAGFGAVSGGRNQLLQLPDFKLGPFPFDSLLASYIESGGQAGFEGRSTGFGSRLRSDNVPYDGILGSEVLKNFVLTVDVPGRKVHLGLPREP